MRKQKRSCWLALALAVFTAVGTMSTGASAVHAAGITPYFLTVQNEVVKTPDGVMFQLRRDFAHPYVIRSENHGRDYNRVLVVELTILNNSGRMFNYTAFTSAADAAGKPLQNAEPLAACEFGTLENGKAANIVARFLLKKENDVSSFHIGYQHMDYSAQYLADMDAYSLGQLPLEEIAAKYAAVPVSFTVTNPKQ
ncbi:hypothetical protein [Lachnoclostridium sp. Marseille-P6806]|uniref:hypothetical protein n=1 Tax=Lachnoclostridium sp. Marseille-P6806 TaxID=2364793 RepID=UPI0010305A74|nr:hypothetical protein [Lachnoclostridium sp. Marseille-P6806]